MIFQLKIKPAKDKFIAKIYKKSMKELGEFYDIKWTMNMPNILVVNTRKELDVFYGSRSPSWVVGFASWNKIFLLNRKKFGKESSHKYSEKYYSSLIKHELSHLFFKIISRGNGNPKWLNEGTAIYTSGQNKERKKPEKFKTFLNFYKEAGAGVYEEAGFVVDMLVEKYGKAKLLKLIKISNKISSEGQFKSEFKKIYGFGLNYKELNKLYVSNSRN